MMKIPEKAISNKYRSKFEEKTANFLDRNNIKYQYESYFINYKVPEKTHRYIPDFVLENGIIIETKGLFKTSDRQKHLLIKQQFPKLDIRFIFYHCHTKIYKGSSTTLAQWADKNGFKWAEKEIPESWLAENGK